MKSDISFHFKGKQQITLLSVPIMSPIKTHSFLKRWQHSCSRNPEISFIHIMTLRALEFILLTIDAHNTQRQLLVTFSSGHKGGSCISSLWPPHLVLYCLPWLHLSILYGFMKRSQPFKLFVAVLQNWTILIRIFNSPKLSLSFEMWEACGLQV